MNSSDILCIPQLIISQTGQDEGVPIDETVDLRVRAKSGQTWSALNQAIFTSNSVKNSLRIQIMYNPANSGANT